MMERSSLQQQQPLQDVVLYDSIIDKGQYADNVLEVKFPDPVQIRTISVAHATQGIPAGQSPTLRAWAKDVTAVSAARFIPVIGTQKHESLGTEISNFQVDEIFSTDHLVINGKFKCLQLTVRGSVVKTAAGLMQVQAEQTLGPLPVANPTLQQLGTAQQLPQPPQLQLHPRPVLPLAHLPAAFVQMLSIAVDYWRKVRLSHSRIEANPPNGRLDGLAELADAVLAALRGKPGALHAKLAAADASSDSSAWSAVSADALDMAASWCKMLASCRTHTPFDMEVGVAGLAAAILLASCTTTAAQFLALIDERQELAGAAAVRGVVCIPNAPPVISRYAIGLLELLLGSCPAVGCATLLGSYTPTIRSEQQDQLQDGQALHATPEASQQQQQMAAACRTAAVQQGATGSGGRFIPEAGRVHHAVGSTAGISSSSGRGERVPAAIGSLSQEQQRGSSPGSGRQGAEASGDAGAVAAADDAEQAAAADGEYEDDEGGLYDELDSQHEEAYDYAGEEEERLSLSGHEDMEYKQEAGDQGAEYADDDGEQLTGNEVTAIGTPASHNGLEGNETPKHSTDTAGALQGGARAAATAVASRNKQDGDGPVGNGNHRDFERRSGHVEAGAGPGSIEKAACSMSRSRNSGGGGDVGLESQRTGQQVVNSSRHHSSERTNSRLHGGIETAGMQAWDADKSRSFGSGSGRQFDSLNGDIDAFRLAKLLRKRRQHAVELCSGVAQLAMQPRRDDVSASCMIVLRRIKSWECITTLHTTIGELLNGSVSALLLPPQDLQQRLHKVGIALADLSDLVLQPVPSGPFYYSQDKRRQLQLEQQQQLLAQQRAGLEEEQGSGNSGSSKWGASAQPRQADVCVLQVLLSFRVLEQLAALLDVAGVHVDRLLQQQQSAAADRQAVVQQLRSLAQEQSGLLCSLQVLLSSLASCATGWAYLQAAAHDLEKLAQAVSHHTKAQLDGGELPLDAVGPYHPLVGRPLLRQQLLSAVNGSSSGISGGAAAAAELSASLQRLVMLAQAVHELQLAPAGGGAKSRVAAAVQTLTQACFASELGREAAICALGSCTPALQQLVLLMKQRCKVLAAAAGAGDETTNELASLEFDDDSPPGAKANGGPQPLYASLYAPELLLAVLEEQHPDVLQHWLPLSDLMLTVVSDELGLQERYGPAAVNSAFPASAPVAGRVQVQNASTAQGGLLLVDEAGAAAATMERQRGVLQQVYGYVDTANQLMMHWKAGDGSGSGSGAFLLAQLQQLLPPLVKVGSTGEEAPAAAGGTTSASGSAAEDAVLGAANVSGVPPPWGKDVNPQGAVELISSQQNYSATMASFNLLSMLLTGAPDGITHMVAAAADRPKDLALFKPALNPAVALNPNGTLGFSGVPDSGAAGRLDALQPQVLVTELLEAGVLDVLERGLRAGVCALEASNSDQQWAGRGGDAVDGLARLRGRAAAASLLLAVSSVAASFMLLLARAEAADLSNCGLLGALTCAHACVVTCHEGLAATIPNKAITTHITAANSSSNSPADRRRAAAAADAAGLRSGAGRCHSLLLQVRQQLSVCLSCWHKCGWWPDAVGAVFGEFPSASAALNQIAAEEAAARARGERGALPAPAPKQGPRQLLAAIFALGDMCPSEWPPAGASQAAIAATEAAAAAGHPALTIAFERPTHMTLRAKIASSLELHMAQLANLVTFAAAAESRLMRAALVRLAVRAGSLGGGMSPFLVPLLLEVLRETLDAAIRAQQLLKQKLQQLAAEGQSAAAQQQEILKAANAAGTPQLTDGRRVVEMLIPLASKPGFKAVLLEGKAVNMMAKYLHKLAIRSKEDVECHVVVGLVLQLVAALCNPDVSLTPLNPRHAREAEDTPLLRDSRDVVAALLASAAMLSPTNMQMAAALLAGPCPAAGGQGFAQYPKGQAALRQGALRWFVSQAPEAAAINAAGQANTPQTLAAAVEWAAGRLSEVAAAPSSDPAHAAACRKVADALRSAGAAAGDTDANVADATVTSALMRFAKAVQESVAAAHPNAASAAEDITTLLNTPAVLLACEVTAAEFWYLNSAATEASQQLHQRPKRSRPIIERSPADAGSVSSMFGPERLVQPKRARVQSGAVQWLLAGAVAEQQQQRQPKVEDTPGRTSDTGEEGPAIPTIMAPRRSANLFKSGGSSRKASLHVDDYESRKPRPTAPQAAGLNVAAAAAGQLGMPPGPFPGGPPLPNMVHPPGMARGMSAPVGPLAGVQPGPHLSAPQAAPMGMHGGAAAGRAMHMAPLRPGAMQQQQQGVPLHARRHPPPAPQQARQPQPQQQTLVRPSDPRQQKHQRQQQPQVSTASAYSEQQQQPGSPGGGGSDILGGLEGNSPSYHSSPGSSVDYGGMTEQGSLADLSRSVDDADDGGAAYRVSEV